MEPERGVAEERDFLLEKNIDASEEDRVSGLVMLFLVQLERQIHRKEGDGVAGGVEGFG
jgi:hypothetical protein